MVSFAGFPLGGLAAMSFTGPVDGVGRAVAGGLLTGAVLGLVQGLVLRFDRRTLGGWVLATALGLAAGLATGASMVGFGTGLRQLAVQGALSGFAVGVAQAAVLLPRVRLLAVLWPGWLAAAWTVGWTVTTSIGVQVENRFTVFGSAGAVTVAALTAVLPVVLARTGAAGTEASGTVHRLAEKSI